MDLVGKRNVQPVLASPDLVLSKKPLKQNQNANSAYQTLGRYAHQSPVSIERKPSNHSDTSTPTIDQFKPVKPISFVSSSDNPVELSKNKKTNEKIQQDKADLPDGSPKFCCNGRSCSNANCECIIL